MLLARKQGTEDPMSADPRRLAVIGAGTMGHGLAEIAALAGLETALVDTEERFLQRGLANIRTSMDRLVASNKVIRADADAALARITTSTDLASAVGDVDAVIEAVPEDLALKHDVFRRLSAATRDGVVLATNTTQFPITRIAEASSRPHDVIGMHFFNPPVLMKLVEIVRGDRTSDGTLQTALAIAKRLGKEPAVCRRDTVGFITSRAAAALRLECIRIYEEGIASIEDIDKALRLGFNHPMGPFELNDYNGLDVSLAATRSLQSAYGERFAPPKSMVARVEAGKLGRKSGAGWYDYSGDKPRAID
jgi:3-hydroxybutyryl-CoA dehydrogenase